MKVLKKLKKKMKNKKKIKIQKKKTVIQLKKKKEKEDLKIKLKNVLDDLENKAQNEDHLKFIQYILKTHPYLGYEKETNPNMYEELYKNNKIECLKLLTAKYHPNHYFNQNLEKVIIIEKICIELNRYLDQYQKHNE